MPETNTYKIVSLTAGPSSIYLGIAFLSHQTIGFNFELQDWRLKGLGDEKFHLGLNYYQYTGLVQDVVTATTNAAENVAWHFTYRPDKEAYTIEQANDQSRRWTVTGSQVKEIWVTQYNGPPECFDDDQLFTLEKITDV